MTSFGNENRTRIKVSDISPEDISNYPLEFSEWAKKERKKPPEIDTWGGKALAAMLNKPGNFWMRDDTDEFTKKFNIDSKDSIQLFNKTEQWGLKGSQEKKKYYIPYPYQTSNKHAMRKDFKFDGTEEQKKIIIQQIKSTIRTDYIDVPDELWQLGHKNPDTTDNSSKNLVLQPPIQAKYRDQYVFIDTLTKMPTPKHFAKLYKNGNLSYTKEQLQQLRYVIDELLVNKN